MEIITELFKMFEKSDFYSVQSIENEYINLLELKDVYKRQQQGCNKSCSFTSSDKISNIG